MLFQIGTHAWGAPRRCFSPSINAGPTPEEISETLREAATLLTGEGLEKGNGPLRKLVAGLSA